MRYLPLIVAIAIFGGLALVNRAGPPGGEWPVAIYVEDLGDDGSENASPAVVALAHESVGSAGGRRLAEVDIPSSAGLREPAELTPTAQDAERADQAIAALEELRRLRVENAELRAELRFAYAKLQLNGVEGSGPVALYLAQLAPDEPRPSEDRLQLMIAFLEAYPVDLYKHEGDWILDRIELYDWSLWGDTIDDALIAYLGPQRIASQVSPEELAALREDWPEYF